VRACALFLHHYPGYTWETMMATRYGVWQALVAEIPRQCADADHRAVVIAHTGDPKDLEERLRYAARPEQAWWNRPATRPEEIDAMLSRIRRP
jgi:hypothetical protein